MAHLVHRLYRAGAELLARDIAERLEPAFHPIFLCLDEVGPLGEELRVQGRTVINLKRRPGFDHALARRLAAVCRRERVDLIHAHQYTPFFYAALSRRLRSRPAILFTEHGRHYPDRRRFKRVLANQLLLRRRDRLSAVGQFVRDALVTHEGLPRDRIEVIHNGVDLSAFTPAPRAEARRELGLAPDAPVVLQIARFHPVKDHGTALRAFTQVARRRPHATLLLAGDGPEFETARRLATELNLGDQVRFLGVRDDVPRLLAGADVFLLSSLSEGVSCTLLEAMACQLPVVATDVGGNPEVVEHGRSGLLSPRGDVSTLARHLAQLLDAPDRRRLMGRAGRERVQHRFSVERMVESYGQLYRSMLACPTTTTSPTAPASSATTEASRTRTSRREAATIAHDATPLPLDHCPETDQAKPAA